MSASAKPTEKVFKSFLAAVLAISLCPLMPADKAQAEEAGNSGEPTDAAQVSDEGEGEETNLAEGIVETDSSNADLDLAEGNDGAEDEGALDDSNVALQAASDSGTPIVNWTKCGTCQWMIDSSGCLIIEPQSGETGELEDWTGSEAPWLEYKSSIVSAKVKKTVIAKTTQKAFYGCESLRSIDLSGLDTSSVTSMASMFGGCSGLKSLDLSSFDTSQVNNMSFMFEGCSRLRSLDVSGWDTSAVKGGYYSDEGMNSMFEGCSRLRSLDVSDWNTSKVTGMDSMFCGCSSLAALDLSSFDTSQVLYMSSMFGGCSGLKSLDLSGLDTSSVTSMSSMFGGCSGLKSLDLSGLDTSSVTSMASMFGGCSSLASLDLSSFDTSQVRSMSSMFKGCSSLAALDVSGWDTSAVEGGYFTGEGMNSMFEGCSRLRSLDVSDWDTSQVNGMSSMFKGCSSLAALDVSGWDTSAAGSKFYYSGGMSSMFEGCSSLRSVTLGRKFSFNGAMGTRQCSLPKLKDDGLTGFWENIETHELYAEDEIPNNVAATYAAQTKTAISESMFTVDTGSRTYTGLPIEPSVSSVSLRQGADYSVAYGENVNAGEGTILITGAGNYKGQVAYSFRIDPRQVGAPEAAAGLVYSGVGQVGVAPSDDYEVSNGSATDAGSYTAIVSLADKQNYEWSGSGNSDDIEVNWSIAKALLTSSMVSDVPSSMETTGSQLTPKPIVTFNGKTLVQGVDYALSYGENVSPGKGTVTVTAVEDGNFTGSVTVEFDIEKKAVPAPVFSDVDYSSWYGDAVSYVASKGLITGYSGTTLFGVGDVLTRAQLATILWRNACPDEYASYDPETAKDTTGIDGSADGMYYTAAANWAVKNGVITGFDREDGSKDFAADDDVSFEQLITILSRLCATSEELSAAGSDLSAFADGDLASSWSRGAFAWAAAKGLVQGYDEPTGKYLRPGDPVARERVAVVLMRAFEMGIMK